MRSDPGISLIRRVDLQAQYSALKAEIDEAVNRVLRSGRYTLGEEVSAFEHEFAAYLGVRTAIGVSDGTRAIALALRLAGVGPGDEVITTAFTAIPTIGAIIETGARPIFVDIDPNSFLMDIELVPAAVTSRTKAILAVHLFGNVVDIDRVRELVGPHLTIVEDAAQAHGSSLRGRRAGSLGDFATFSFYPTKNLGCYGDGGAIVTNSAERAEELRILRNHGMRDKDVCVTPGVNSRLDELQAAILRAKLRHLDAMNRARAARVRQYMVGLSRDLFRHQRIGDGVESNWHVFETRFLGDRDRLVRDLDESGIQTNIYYVVPHHLQPGLAYLGYREGDLPDTELVCRQGIALPLYPEIEERVVEKVIESINSLSRSHQEGLAETRA